MNMAKLCAALSVTADVSAHGEQSFTSLKSLLKSGKRRSLSWTAIDLPIGASNSTNPRWDNKKSHRYMALAYLL
jgi:hypothetical protein